MFFYQIIIAENEPLYNRKTISRVIFLSLNIEINGTNSVIFFFRQPYVSFNYKVRLRPYHKVSLTNLKSFGLKNYKTVN